MTAKTICSPIFSSLCSPSCGAAKQVPVFKVGATAELFPAAAFAVRFTHTGGALPLRLTLRWRLQTSLSRCTQPRHLRTGPAHSWGSFSRWWHNQGLTRKPARDAAEQDETPRHHHLAPALQSEIWLICATNYYWCRCRGCRGPGPYQTAAICNLYNWSCLDGDL